MSSNRINPTPELQKIAAAALARQTLVSARVQTHSPALPLRVGTRASPLALVQTRSFLTMLTRFCPVLRDMGAFQEYQINTTGDQVQNRRLADIGGKGLFAKEIHEALLDGRIDFAVHSLKDLETSLPKGLVLACTLRREDARDAMILRRDLHNVVSIEDPLRSLPEGALIGSCSVRRQAQLLHLRPDLRFTLLRGNVQTRLDKLAAQHCDVTLLAYAGLKRLGMEDRVDILLAPDFIVPAAGQGIIGVTVREKDVELLELLSAIEDYEARAVSTAERALLAELDGSCRTPIGGYARLVKERGGQMLHLTGMVAREDGTFLLRRSLSGVAEDADRMGRELGRSLRMDSPPDIFRR